MPGGDGTGPLGRGPFTGRGMGYCVVKLPAGAEVPQGHVVVAGSPVEPRVPSAWKVASLRRLAGSLQKRLDSMHARIAQIERRGG